VTENRFQKYHIKTARKPTIYINMKPLKQFAYEKLPECALKKILLIEHDFLDVDIFLARLPLWLNLIKILGR